MRATPRAPGALCLALVRLLRTVVIVGFAAFAVVLLALRFVVLPHVESYRDTLAGTLSLELGRPVEIASLTTGWDGWNPKLVIQGFRVLDRAGPGASPLVELPEIGLVVSWTSLTFLDLRLKELVIERPRLAIRRNRAGLLQVAGIEFDPAQVSEQPTLSDWILRQREIVVRDALITWDDDLRNAPQLVLDRVQFRMESAFGRHRFGLKGVPPAELAAPLDLRGDLRGDSFNDWQRAEGMLYVRLDYADVAAWREWLPLPPELARGKGALRVWLQFADGEPRGITADVELADVSVRLGDRLPELALAHLSGRAGWNRSATQRDVYTQGLSFTTAAGEHFDPTNFRLTLRDGARPSGQMEFDHLQLSPLTAIASHLPLSERVRADLARFAPRGTLSQGRLRWEGAADAPASFAATGDFAHLGLLAQDELPGAVGLTGHFDVASDRGAVKLASEAAEVSLPRVFAAPIVFDRLRGSVKWERRDGTTAVRIDQLEFANADAAGTLIGTYRTGAQGPGEIDLTAQASHVDARRVHAYLPNLIDADTRGWLKRALAGGSGTDVRLKLAGPLSQFPFANGKGGQFVVTAKVRDVTLAYAESWPAIESIDAEARFDGVRMKIDAAHARSNGVDIARTTAEIGDLTAQNPLLRIEGRAAGPMAGFVQFTRDSPVAGWIDSRRPEVDASGAAQLALKLALPLRRLAETKVGGELTFANADLRVAGLPALTKVNGKVAFSERDVRARDVALEALGGPATINVASADGVTRVTGAGTLTVAALRREFPSGHLDRVSGATDWSISVTAQAESAAWVLQSSLKGAGVDLPAPLGKQPGDAVPLRIERRDDPARRGADLFTVSYGRVAQLVARRGGAGGGASLDRALLTLGAAVERTDSGRAERPGLWVRADLPTLDADEWVAVLRRESATPPSPSPVEPLPAFAGADLDVGLLEAFGVRLAALKVGMRQAEGGWNLDLAGRDLAGTATWSAPDSGAPNGRLVARLSRLTLPDRPNPAIARGGAGRDPTAEPKSDVAAGNSWPAIDIDASALVSKGRELGRLEFVAQPSGTEWRIDRLVLANESGRLEAEGAWRTSGRQQQTKLDIILDVKEAAPFLARFGYPDALQGAPTKIDGQLAWTGAPHEFDFPTLSGAFHIGVGPGRFTKIEPGPGGKLLGVLSLQALPRRLTLDFRDVFSDGFSFDEVGGNVRIASGVMSTSNLTLVGPAARIEIAGETDLAKETQRLSVRVQPALSSSVSAGAALLFLANPLIGAAVGAGSFLAQTMLKDPIEKMFTYEFTVTGSWSDPLVTRDVAGAASSAKAPEPPTAGVVR